MSSHTRSMSDMSQPQELEAGFHMPAARRADIGPGSRPRIL